MTRVKMSRRGFLTGTVGMTLLMAACAAPAPTQAPAKPSAGEAQKPADKPAQSTPAAQAAAGTKPTTTIKINTRNGAREKWMAKFGQEFEKANPGVKVAVEEFPSAEYYVKLRALVASNQVADVVWGYIGGGAWLALAAQNVLRPADDFAKAEPADFLKGFYAPAVAVASLDGKLYGLPERSWPGYVVMAYNQTAFEKAEVGLPTTDWTLEKEYLAAAQRLTVRSGDRTEQFGALTRNNWAGLVPILRSWGGELIDADGTKCVLSSTQNEGAVQFLVDLMDKHRVAPAPQQVEETPSKMFVSGKAVTYANVPPGEHGGNEKAIGDRFKIGGTLTPKGPAGLGIMLGAHTLGISRDSKAAEEAWKLIKYFASHEVGVLKAIQEGSDPGARPDVYHDPRFQKADPLNPLLATAMDQAQSHPIPKNLRGTEMYSTLDNEMDQIWQGKVSVSDGLKRAQDEIQKVIDKPR